jgi:hypothetical protein
MRNNLDGTFLDPDRRPRRLTYAWPASDKQPVGVQRKAPPWTRARWLFPYFVVVLNAVAGGSAFWCGQQWRWGWLTLVGLIFALAACTQVALIVITGFDPDRRRRHATFVTMNSAVLVLTDIALFTVVVVAWRMEPSDLLRWFTTGVAVALLFDLAWVRPWRLWLKTIHTN